MKILIVVDMQNDFINGSLGSAEAEAIVPFVKNKINECICSGNEVIFTRDTHTEDYLNTSEGKNLPVVHCVKGTHGWQIADGIYADGAKIIDKPSFGWLGWRDEFEKIKNELTEIELIGLCTDICVVSNALILKAMFPEITVSVDPSCCAGVTPQTHTSALETMKMCQIKVKQVK